MPVIREVSFGDPALGIAVLDGLRGVLGGALISVEARERLLTYPEGEKTEHDEKAREALDRLTVLLLSDVSPGTAVANNPFTPTMLMAVLKVVVKVIRAAGLIDWLKGKVQQSRTPWDDWAIEVLEKVCEWIEEA